MLWFCILRSNQSFPNPLLKSYRGLWLMLQLWCSDWRHCWRKYVCSLTVPIIWCDNLSTVALIAYFILHACNKHVELDMWFIKEKVVTRWLLVQHIPSCEQVIDILTKLFFVQSFLKILSKIDVHCIPLSLTRSDKSINGAVYYDVANEVYDGSGV